MIPTCALPAACEVGILIPVPQVRRGGSETGANPPRAIQLVHTEQEWEPTGLTPQPEFSHF